MLFDVFDKRCVVYSPLKVYTEEAELLHLEYTNVHDLHGCSCHICSPCCNCTHPGNPYNLECDEENFRPATQSEIIWHTNRALESL